jgi:hypothetical protein
MLNLTLKGVDVFIKKSKTKTQESFWNNYDLVIWKKDNGGYTNIKGLYRKDQWGTAENISVDKNGIWKLPFKYVKHFK